VSGGALTAAQSSEGIRHASVSHHPHTSTFPEHTLTWGQGALHQLPPPEALNSPAELETHIANSFTKAGISGKDMLPGLDAGTSQHLAVVGRVRQKKQRNGKGDLRHPRKVEPQQLSSPGEGESSRAGTANGVLRNALFGNIIIGLPTPYPFGRTRLTVRCGAQKSFSANGWQLPDTEH
jgi:hypothetical protein